MPVGMRRVLVVRWMRWKEKLETGKVEVRVDIDLKQDDSGYLLGATLNVVVPGLDRAAAEKLVQAAHAMCPYSKATRGNIEVTLKVNDEPFAQAA